MINTDTDIAILPKSGGLFYATTDPRQNPSPVQPYFSEMLQRDSYMHVNNFRILPNGLDNNFPSAYKSALDSVYLAHGAKRTLINLLLSGGVMPYIEQKNGTRIEKNWLIETEAAELYDWLKSWDFWDKYLPEAATDMIYVENNTAVLTRNRGWRTNPQIASLAFIDSEESRLDWVEIGKKHRFVYRADWGFRSNILAEVEEIPIFDRKNPFAAPHMAMFQKMPTFGSFGYGRPTDIGAMEWLSLLAILPRFHKANLTELPIRWLVKINSATYKAVQAANNWTATSPEFIQWKQEFKKAIDDFLIAANGDRVQTRFMSEFTVMPNGNIEDKIIIEPLKDNTLDLSRVGLDLNETASAAYVSSLSLNPQLANINLKNHALSGSNLVEAYNIHIAIATPMLRSLLLEPVNTAIALNWPKKGWKLGFQDIVFANNHTENNPQKDGNTSI